MEQPTVYYVVNARMPTEKAHGTQIAKMCEAFAAAGQKVVLLVPKFKDSNAELVYAAYKVAPSFAVEFVPVIRLPLWIPGAFLLQSAHYAYVAARHIRSLQNVLVYTRGETILLLERFLPKYVPVVWETHIRPDRPERYTQAAQRAAAIITVTKYYEREIPTLWNVDSARVFCAPDAVALEDFDHPQTKEESRNRLGLSLQDKIVMYIGRVDGWKGLDMLCEASKLLPSGIQMVVIGGESAQVAALQDSYPSVRFLGYSPYEQLANNQVAADILVLTGNPASEIAQHYTSPLKLFTYMASGVPILAVDLPSYRDVLSEDTAFFSKPTVEDLAHSIEHLLAHQEDAAKRATAAKELVKEYSWHARAVHIVEHLKSVVTSQ